MTKSSQKKEQNLNEKEIQRNFNEEVIFGPIFICSCCHRKLYENGVTKLTAEMKEAFEGKKSQHLEDMHSQGNKNQHNIQWQP